MQERQLAGGAEGHGHLSGVFIFRLPNCLSGIIPLNDNLSVEKGKPKSAFPRNKISFLSTIT